MNEWSSPDLGSTLLPGYLHGESTDLGQPEKQVSQQAYYIPGTSRLKERAHSGTQQDKGAQPAWSRERGPGWEPGGLRVCETGRYSFFS